MLNFEELIGFGLWDCDNSRGVSRLNIDEAAALYSNVRGLRYCNVLEIGAMNNGTTAMLACALDPTCTLFSLDVNHLKSPLSMMLINKYGCRTEIIECDSKEYRPHMLGFLFVDGDHSYEGVCADIKQYWNRLEVGGKAAFHDAVPCKTPGYCEGTRMAIADMLIGTCAAELVDRVRSLLIVRKVKDI